MRDAYINSKNMELTGGVCRYGLLTGAVISRPVSAFWLDKLPGSMRPELKEEAAFFYRAGEELPAVNVSEPEGFSLQIAPSGIRIDARDRSGLCYGLLELASMLDTAGSEVPCVRFLDHPAVRNRALMLDVSRGKVYTREYLLFLADLLASLRYNTLQLYVEHTFAFPSHPEISRGCSPLTAEDIIALRDACRERCISLQPCLQSLGHCRHLLRIPGFRGLRESDMYWSFSTTESRVWDLLDSLYGDYLPLFDDPVVNVCLDEPYDLGSDASSGKGKTKSELYLGYLDKLREIGAKYGKRLMVFGDVFAHNPDLARAIPEDVILLDWCYDPKPEYGTPAVLAKTGKEFWICPGTGNWNTLFPRLDGALMNIDRFLEEGLASGASGMMLTDWNDHGAYTQPAPCYFIYAYGAAAAWNGKAVSREAAAETADRVLKMPGYSEIILRLAEIYQLPPLWSKNRSECVMALFDEPVMGKTVRGPLPPAGLKAYDLNLPDGIGHVFERHAMHPLRPVFSFPEETLARIRSAVESVRPRVGALPSGFIKDELLYILDAFELMTDKLAFSRDLLSRFASGGLSAEQLLDLEMASDGLKRRYARLQLAYCRLWDEIAAPSEIEISLSYFAHIIERLDYLSDWLSIQRDRVREGLLPDYAFASYETAGYETLPTY